MADRPPRRQPPAARGGGAGSSLQRKLGPFPVWVWAIIGAAVAYYVYKHYSSTSAATGTTPASGSTAAPLPAGDQSGSAGGGGGSVPNAGVTSTDTTGQVQSAYTPASPTDVMASSGPTATGSVVVGSSSGTQLGYYMPAPSTVSYSGAVTQGTPRPGSTTAIAPTQVGTIGSPHTGGPSNL